jgi:phage terminase small subunit
VAKPKYANGKTKKIGRLPRAVEQVLVPANPEKPVDIQKVISNNPELERYAQVTSLHVLQMWSALATVDVNEIVRVEKRSCRFCHGIEHRYQWVTDDEWANDAAARIDLGKEPRDCSGGFGYNPHAKPHASCPACHGDGEPHVAIADYREMSPAARLLYNGAKMGKHGIEVMLRDRDAILEKLGKHLGMFKDQVEHTGKGGAPITFMLTRDEEAL